MSASVPIGRFAPSPTGALHRGNLRTALASWLSVKARGGRWLLRIEDVDRHRCRREWAEQQVRDLAALGLESDGPVVWQSERDTQYLEALARLQEQRLLYVCQCSRKDLSLMASAPQTDDGLRPYPGRCRGRVPATLEPAALRFHLPPGEVAWLDRVHGPQRHDPCALTGDPLLHRRDGCFAYHLAVVVDDGLQGVTEIVRGDDLRPVTATQIRLQEALGFARPEYAHVALVHGDQGQRLGKRGGAEGVQAWLAEGRSLPDLLGHLGHSLGCLDRPEPCIAADLLKTFKWERVPEAGR